MFKKNIKKLSYFQEQMEKSDLYYHTYKIYRVNKKKEPLKKYRYRCFLISSFEKI